MDQVDESMNHAVEVLSALDAAIGEGRYEEAALLQKEVCPLPPYPLQMSAIAQRRDCKSVHHLLLWHTLFFWHLARMARLMVLL